MMATRKTPRDVTMILAEADKQDDLDVRISMQDGKEVVRVAYTADSISSIEADLIMSKLTKEHCFKLTLSLGETKVFGVY